MPEKRVLKSLAFSFRKRYANWARCEEKGDAAHYFNAIVHLYQLVEDFLANSIDDRNTGYTKAPGGIDHLAVERGNF